MKVLSFSSSAFVSLRYDEGRQELTVDFTNGARYAYSNVPPEVIAELDKASSKGAMFNALIRNRYEERRLI